MAYTDEWWKWKPGALDEQDEIGAGYYTDVQPDRFSNEEWWGIMAAENNGNSPDIVHPRLIYDALKEEFEDTDGDAVEDVDDNCLERENTQQIDADGDRFGNACDCDFNQDGGCGQPDYSVFIACFGKPVPASGPADDPTCEESDMNGDGGVGQRDYSLFISLFGGFPGPSGVADGGGGVASAAQAPCGLGSELALLLPPLMWLWRRRTAASQDIPHSARCNCSAPQSCPPAQTPQVAIRFAFIRSWRALTRAAARSMTTASVLSADRRSHT